MCIIVSIQMYVAILVLKFRTLHSRFIRILTAVVDLDLYKLLGWLHVPNLEVSTSMYPGTMRYCSFVNKAGVVLLTHCDQNYIRTEISMSGFLYVSR